MASPSRQCVICGPTSRELFPVKSVGGASESDETKWLRIRQTKDYLVAISRPDLTEEQEDLEDYKICSRHFGSEKPAPLDRPDLVDWVPTFDLNRGLSVEEDTVVEQPRPGLSLAATRVAARSLAGIQTHHGLTPAKRPLDQGEDEGAAQQSRPASVPARTASSTNMVPPPEAPRHHARLGIVIPYSPTGKAGSSSTATETTTSRSAGRDKLRKAPTTAEVGVTILSSSSMQPNPPTEVGQPAVGGEPKNSFSFSLALEAAVANYLPALEEPHQIQAAPIEDRQNLDDQQIGAQLVSQLLKWDSLGKEPGKRMSEYLVAAIKATLLKEELTKPVQDRKEVHVTEEKVLSGITMAYARPYRELLLELKAVKEETTAAASTLSKTDKNKRIVDALKAHLPLFSSLFDELSTDSTTDK